MATRFALAKERAVDAIDELVPELFGGGRMQTHRYGGRWAVANKWRPKAKLEQMSVWRTGARRGVFKDYGGDAKGDAIDFVAYGLTGEVSPATRIRAVDWLEDRFGIRDMSDGERAELNAKAAAKRLQVEADEAVLQKANRQRAQKFFFSCEPTLRGTRAERYLAGRGIALDQVPFLSSALRFHAECLYWMGTRRDGEGNPIGAAPAFPAIVSCMIDASGIPGACHYTFLEPDGSAKLKTGARGYLGPDGAPVSAKLMFPASSGLFVPVTYGPSGLKPNEAATKGIAGFTGWTEGIEDALSAAIATPVLRMHAAGSLGHLLSVPDLACSSGNLVFEDNDWGKPQAQAVFARALARLRSFGKPTEPLAMPAAWGKDVNDALNSV